MAPRGNVPHDDFKSPSRQSGNQGNVRCAPGSPGQASYGIGIDAVPYGRAGGTTKHRDKALSFTD